MLKPNPITPESKADLELDGFVSGSLSEAEPEIAIYTPEQTNHEELVGISDEDLALIFEVLVDKEMPASDIGELRRCIERSLSSIDLGSLSGFMADSGVVIGRGQTDDRHHDLVVYDDLALAKTFKLLKRAEHSVGLLPLEIIEGKYPRSYNPVVLAERALTRFRYDGIHQKYIESKRRGIDRVKWARERIQEFIDELENDQAPHTTIIPKSRIELPLLDASGSELDKHRDEQILRGSGVVDSEIEIRDDKRCADIDLNSAIRDFLSLRSGIEHWHDIKPLLTELMPLIGRAGQVVKGEGDLVYDLSFDDFTELIKLDKNLANAIYAGIINLARKMEAASPRTRVSIRHGDLR